MCEGLLSKLKECILRVLNDKYNSEEADYVSVNRIADEQGKFYIIETNENCTSC